MQDSCLCNCPRRFIAPIIIVVNLKFIPDTVKVLVGIGLAVGFLYYILKNSALLMGMDAGLAILHCNYTARKRFVLPQSFSIQKVEKRIGRFGQKYEPTAIFPRPETLQYKSHAPIMIYSAVLRRLL